MFGQNVKFFCIKNKLLPDKAKACIFFTTHSRQNVAAEVRNLPEARRSQSQCPED